MHDTTVDYAETGAGPTVVLVPGSLSTGAAWKPVVARLDGRFRLVTTSLLGNGLTAERRSPANPSIELQADALEQVIRRAGGPVHVVTHSYGGVGILALALRGSVEIASLTLIEPNPADVLRQAGELELFRQFRRMSDAYAASFAAGESEAVSRMVDFYGGPGSYAVLPQRARDHLVACTPSNILDWVSMYGFASPLAAYARITAPTVIVRGMRGHPGMIRIAEILRDAIGHASLVSIEDANHFMLPSHAARLAALIADQATCAVAA